MKELDKHKRTKVDKKKIRAEQQKCMKFMLKQPAGRLAWHHLRFVPSSLA